MNSSVWVIGGGKGGVGKTFVCSSLGVTMSKLNQSVLLIDFDLSGANLHTTFGLPLSERNLRAFFDGSHKLIDLIQPTNIPRLSYIQGFWDDWSLCAISIEQVRRLVDMAKSLGFDIVMLDLGTGAGSSNMELIKLADEKIFVVDPEPTSIEKMYRYIEAFICHNLRENATAESFLQIQNALKEYRKKDSKGLFSFREYMRTATGFSLNHFESLYEQPIRLILNNSRSHQDEDLGRSIQSVCKKYFDISMSYLGAIDYDNSVWRSTRDKAPVLIEKPFTPIAGQFLNIGKQLQQIENQRKNSAKVFKSVV